MHKIALSAIIIASFAVSALSQTTTQPAPKKAEPATKIDAEKKAEQGDKNSKDPFSQFSVSSDEIFEVTWPSFSKKTDIKGRGDILEVQFSIINKTDNKHQLYAFVLASYEEIKWKKSSFDSKDSKTLGNDKYIVKQKPVPDGIKIDYFAPFPDKLENFEYDINGEKQYRKFPKDFKLGTDSETGKIYFLNDKINFRTEHLNVYRRNFKFFNNVTIIVYDDLGKMMFRQTYELKGRRTR
jgi:hypothetical protein